MAGISNIGNEIGCYKSAFQKVSPRKVELTIKAAIVVAKKYEAPFLLPLVTPYFLHI
ncbi:hypothetical protein ACXM0N_07140 [Peribacillus simplex]